MLSSEGFAFFRRLLYLVTQLKLQPFALRNGLLVDAESKRRRLMGWTSVVLNILYVPLVIRRIMEDGKIEGVVHSLLIPFFVGSITLKMTILMYHSELIQVSNSVLLIGPKIGNMSLSCKKHTGILCFTFLNERRI